MTKSLSDQQLELNAVDLLAVVLTTAGGSVFVPYEVIETLDVQGKTLAIAEDMQRYGYVISLVNEDEIDTTD